MKLLWILDTKDEEEEVKFLDLMEKLNMGRFFDYMYTYDRASKATKDTVTWRGWFKERKYSGRLAIWAGIHHYQECCGLSIISQPKFNYEFHGKDVMWPVQPTPIYTIDGDSPSNYDKDVVYVGSYDTVEKLSNAITNSLTLNIGHRGAYLISDYGDGTGQLFPFCDLFMHREDFSLEKAAAFVNGNTGAILGTWIARNLKAGRNRTRQNDPRMPLSLIKEFPNTFPSTADWLMGGW